MGLFPRPQSARGSNIGDLRSMIGGDPEAFARQLMRGNPAFADFVRRNQGKTPEQIAQENGIDYSAVRRLMGS